MKNSKLICYSIINALGTFVYISVVAFIMSNGEKCFGGDETLWIPIAILTLFVASAGITGFLVLGRPIHLYLNGLKSEAIKVLIYTLTDLFFIAVSIFLVNYLLR